MRRTPIDAHAERGAEARDFETDRTEADDAERQALEIDDVVRLPGAPPLRVLPAREVAREREQVEHHRLRDRHRVRARRGGEPHAARAQRLEPRVVDAGAEGVEPAQLLRVAQREHELAHALREEVAGEERDLDALGSPSQASGRSTTRATPGAAASSAAP